MKRIIVVLAVFAAATACKPSPPLKPLRHAITCQLPPKFREDLPNANIIIDPDGHLTWNKSPITRDQLNEYLGDVSKYDLQPRITFGPKDVDAPYSRIAPLFRLAYEKKAYRIGLTTSASLVKAPEPNWTGIMTWVECWAGPGQQPVPPTQNIITITSTSGFIWNGRAISHSDLVQRIKQAGRTTPEPLIFLKIAPDARFFAASDLMHEIDAFGPRQIRFETD